MSGFQDSISNMDDLPPEIDPNFEPQPRIRSHTWPSRPKEFSVPPQDGEQEPNCSPSAVSETDACEIKAQDAMGLKKSSSRRNAWGNLSYADLITKAIQSSPDQRLTLSQIYDWMVQNVPYFKDKGDSNSSAGWKNSIRHNLSLHNRFMRMQNEGTGKSSWWVINPDAKPGKSPRRRATSMDTKAYEKKRGRAKKKVDQLRAAMEAGGHSPTSPISETGDYSPLPAFSLSPSDFRPRASSNASSCGRLSPIPAIEPDLHDSQVPSMSPIPWGNDGMGSCGNLSYNSDYTDLTENFGDMMTLGDMSYKDSLGPLNEVPGMGSNSSIPQMMNAYDSYSQNSEYDYNMPPPPYPSNNSPSVVQQQSQPQVGNNITTNGNTGNTYINLTTPQMDVYNAEALIRQDPMLNNPLSSNASNTFRAINGVSQTRMSGGSVLTTSAFQNGRGISPLARPSATQPVSDSLLRAALTQKQVPSFGTQAPTIQINNYSNMNSASATMQQLLNYGPNGGINSFPNDLDFNLDGLQPEGLECDVNQVIQHELSVDGNLDFTFDPSTPTHNAVR